VSAVESIDTSELSQLEPYRRELTAYCYRMLASPYDAEDAVQDTLVRAWRSLSRFEDRAGLRPWLYRIATNVCLDMLKARRRRALPMDLAPAATGATNWSAHELSLGAARPEATWVQPIPDHLISSPDPDPSEVAISRESIRLAFIAALQHLLPRQRAVLILRDVLKWRASEVAELLETSEDAVNSTLRRARSALADANIDAVPTEPIDVDRELLGRYVDAFKRYDVDALVALLRQDAILAMPPFELWLQGQVDIRRFLMAMQSEAGRDHVVPLAANGSPALAVYRPTGPSGTLEAFSIQVLEAVDGRIVRLNAFLDPGLFPIFGLPARAQVHGLTEADKID
jgi:RNA polymerase sigma-70 factor, ECF subfamily